MSIEVSLHLAPFDPSFVAALAHLNEAVFGTPKADLAWRLERMPAASVACASADGRLVGFKAGYAVGATRYYSWLGGVHAEFRRGGIASALMRQQHAWLLEQGFGSVETATNHDNASMIQANLKHGFVICGLRHKPPRVQVLLQRNLLAAEP